jgi:hypothetical protein
MFRDMPNKWESWQNSVAAMMFLGLNHYQVLAMMYRGNIAWPNITASVFEGWNFSEDPMSWFSITCAGLQGFQANYVAKVLTPLVVLMVFGFTYGCTHIAGKPEIAMEGDRLVNVYMSLLFTFFAGIASSTLSLFKCSENPNGKPTLSEDQDIICFEDPVWLGTLGVAIHATILYCIGLIVLFVVIIWSAPAKFAQISFQKRWKFLCIKYRPQIYGWSLVFMMKAIFLNIGFMFLLVGLAQMQWIYSITFVYMSACIFCFPWRVSAANGLEFVANISIITGSSLASLFAYQSDYSEEAKTGQDTLTAIVSFTPFYFGSILFVKVFIDKCDKPVFKALFDSCSGCRSRTAEDYAAEVYQCGRVLNALGETDMAKFLHSLGEWDQRRLYQAARVVNSELTGSTINRLSPRDEDSQSWTRSVTQSLNVEHATPNGNTNQKDSGSKETVPSTSPKEVLASNIDNQNIMEALRLENQLVTQELKQVKAMVEKMNTWMEGQHELI